MAERKYIVITTINHPSQGIRRIAETCKDWHIIVVGDRKTPADWNCERVQFLSLQDQLELDSGLATKSPLNHYSRKNIGYLKAIRDGAQVIAETDDDNIPYDSFLVSVKKNIRGRPVEKHGWENVYTHFSGERIWPRGFPLEFVNSSLRTRSLLGKESIFDCPIQQYLVNGDPDVDAVYRMIMSREDINFDDNTVILSDGTFSPFNSQNTIWWPEAYPLLYLPSFVSFRMTDIWRSFVAQVCLCRLGKCIAFREPTMFQIRNEHSFIHDFKDEIPGYLNNAKIMGILSSLDLSNKPYETGKNLRLCYESLVAAGIMLEEELQLINLWLRDLSEVRESRAPENGGGN